MKPRELFNRNHIHTFGLSRFMATEWFDYREEIDILQHNLTILENKRMLLNKILIFFLTKIFL